MYEMLIKIIVLPILILFFGIFFGLLYKGLDRKLAAHMQARIGPPIRQPFRDVRKLFVKESIVPENAVGWFFNAVPIIGLASSVLILLYLPLGLPYTPVFSGYGDVILIVYLLTIPALAMVAGGFSSGSPYASVGAQREMVMMMSYELPLAVVVISLAWKLSSSHPGVEAFSLNAFSSYPIWGTVGPAGFIGLCILFLTLLIVMPTQLSKIPFDSSEAETEIAGGLLAEYSGRNLAMFYLSDAVKTVAIASFVVALFFPYSIAHFFNIGSLGVIVDFLFFLLKIFIVIFVSVILVRVAFARLKIDQISSMYWFVISILGLLGLMLIVIDSMLVLI